MRIGIDARYLNGEYSGIAKYSELLIESIAKIDSTNDYVVYIHPGYKDKLDVGENFVFRKFNARPVSMQTMWGFGKFIEPDNLDLLHSLYPLAPVTFDGQLLVTVHDLQPLKDPSFTARRRWFRKLSYDLFYRWSYPTTIKRADYIVTVSKSTAQDVAEMFPSKTQDIIAVQSGLEASIHEQPDAEYINEVCKSYSLPENYLLYIGSTRPNKNLPNMIRAFADVLSHSRNIESESFKDICLVLVVNPDRFFAECRDLIKQLGIQDRVKIYRKISEAEKKVFYVKARLLYFVTKHEGFGFPVLEAQACGTPVLASNHSSLPEVSGAASLHVDPDDVEQITDGLIRILVNEKLVEEMRQAGLNNVQRFTWERTARRVHELYENLF